VLEKWFQKIFISIMPVEDGYEVLCVSLKNNKIIFREQNHFVGEIPSSAMNRYIQAKIDVTPYFYISTLNLHANQGAYEGCARPSVHFHNDVVGISTLKRNGLWTQYAQAEELQRLKTHYGVVGLDCIFSPFSMIEFYFADKIPNTFALYAFGGLGFFAVAIFDEGKLEYAHYYTSNNATKSDKDEPSLSFGSLGSDEPESKHQPIALDDIEGLDDLDILDDLDSFSDIANLDDLDEVNEFSEDIVTPEEIRHIRDNGMDAAQHSIDNSGEEYERFEFIQKTLERFYTSSQCKNRFVETVCIADVNLGGEDLKRYLEEELFVNVLVRRVNACEGIHALALMEVGQ
jgi:hypothetical protein